MTPEAMERLANSHRQPYSLFCPGQLVWLSTQNVPPPPLPFLQIIPLVHRPLKDFSNHHPDICLAEVSFAHAFPFNISCVPAEACLPVTSSPLCSSLMAYLPIWLAYRQLGNPIPGRLGRVRSGGAYMGILSIHPRPRADLQFSQ